MCLKSLIITMMKKETLKFRKETGLESAGVDFS